MMNQIFGIPRKWWPKIKLNQLASVHQATKFFVLVLKLKLRLIGARKTKNSKFTNLLILNRETELGEKNTNIYIEPDDVIYRSVMLKGTWCAEESHYLSSLLEANSVLLDLGANVGLISLQVVNINPNFYQVIAVEPRRNTNKNLILNLEKPCSQKGVRLQVCKFALGSTSGKFPIYTEKSNIGNSSLLKELTPAAEFEIITVRAANDFYNELLIKSRSIVIKSDLQGMDIEVLLNFPMIFWENVIGGIIEIWPHSMLEKKEIKKIIQIISQKFKMSFDPYHLDSIDAESLFLYWTNTTNKSANLYFRH